ncbi:MAG: hypothetical protein JXA54_11495 [Candidatus Heimdallarchaeota archaeon]|nr:hypothetical protein [Candidatus Heimdallarchaeota archaeon]
MKKESYDDYIKLVVGGVTVYSEMNKIYLDGDSIYREVPYQPIPGAITYGTLSVSLFARTYPRPTWGFLHRCEYNLYWLGGWTISHTQVRV